MTFHELLQKRQSCRAYKDIPVEREKLLTCIEAARLSPSACNSQPWGFVVVDDPVVAKQIPPLMQSGIMPINRFTQDCNAFIIVVEEPTNISSKLGSTIKNQQFAQIDIGIASHALCLSAAEQGLGSCIMGYFNEKKIKGLLGIPLSKRIRLIIAIGYPTDTDPLRRKVRKPIEEILHLNKW